MSKKPRIPGGDGYDLMEHNAGTVLLAGASNPTVVTGIVASAARVVTAGAVPFLRITLRGTKNPTEYAVAFGLRHDTPVFVQETTTLVATAGALDTAKNIDVRFFSQAGANIEPPSGAVLSIVMDHDSLR